MPETKVTYYLLYQAAQSKEPPHWTLQVDNHPALPHLFGKNRKLAEPPTDEVAAWLVKRGVFQKLHWSPMSNGHDILGVLASGPLSDPLRHLFGYPSKLSRRVHSHDSDVLDDFASILRMFGHEVTVRPRGFKLQLEVRVDDQLYQLLWVNETDRPGGGYTQIYRLAL